MNNVFWSSDQKQKSLALWICINILLLSFLGEDAKYRIQERPSSLLSPETESLLERRNSKCYCFVIEWFSIQCLKTET